MGIQATLDIHPCLRRSRWHYQVTTIRPRGGNQLFSDVDVLHHSLGNRGTKVFSFCFTAPELIGRLAGYSSFRDKFLRTVLDRSFAYDKVK